jgi:adenosylcobinamide-GDP ribazoletransferase
MRRVPRFLPELGARLRRMPADTSMALAFFSRLPVRVRARPFSMREGAGAWPVSGLLLAGPPALLLLVLSAVNIPPLVAAALTLAALAALIGALHEDGLADTADGFGGGHTQTQKLAIMRDSRLGTFGALALLFAALTKVGALAALAPEPSHAAFGLLAAAVLSRSLALWHWSSTLPARDEGLAWTAGRPDAAALALGLGFGAAAALALLVMFGAAILLALLLGGIAIGLFSQLCRRQIGGHTGDTIGAAQQIAETLILAGLSAGRPIVVF